MGSWCGAAVGDSFNVDVECIKADKLWQIKSKNGPEPYLYYFQMNGDGPQRVLGGDGPEMEALGTLYRVRGQW